MSTAGSVRGDADFSRLWVGLAASQLGSAVGMVALPVVAVVVVGASAFQVALLTAISAATVAVLAFPIGSQVEGRRKRPVLVAADLLRFAALVAVPVTGWLGVLTFTQLCVTAAVTALGQIVFRAASQAHLKALVGTERVIDGTGRLESTQWLSLTVGPSIGGVLVAVVGALGTLLVDAVSFLLSAAAVRRIRRLEPDPTPRGEESWRAELFGGLAFAWGDPALRLLLISWVLFAGSVAMSTPVAIVFYLRELHFSPVAYGLLLGLPSLAGVLGARLSRRAVARWGVLPTLRRASLLRTPGQFLIPLAVPGTAGLLMCLAGISVGLFFSALVNTTTAGYRAVRTPDALMVRVSTLWSFATTVAQPVFALIGGVLATVVGIRAALVAAAGVMVLAAALVLPVGVGPPGDD